MIPIIVDTTETLQFFLDDVQNQPTYPPSLYLDIEGIDLGRQGSISVLQVFNLTQNVVYLVDIYVLQGAVFDTANQSGATLRSILESTSIPKVFFDVRNDADALYAHFKILLQNVHDVQLLNAATRSRRHVLLSLATCIQKDAGLSVEAQEQCQVIKNKGRTLFAPEHGGSYEVLNIRPMIHDIIEYCAQDVVYLPVLWKNYMAIIEPQWLERVQQETVKRVMLAWDESYDPHGNNKTRSPWPEENKRSNSASAGRGLVETRFQEIPFIPFNPRTTAPGTFPLIVMRKPKNSKLSSAKWVCTTCDREMGLAQREEHLDGTPHQERLEKLRNAMGPGGKPEVKKSYVEFWPIPRIPSPPYDN